LRAVRALLAADIILVDELVSPDIVDFARREAKKMLVGGTGKGSACEQDEINKVMVVLAKAGRRVVRLTRGEGATLSRDSAAIAACRAAGIAVEIVLVSARPKPRLRASCVALFLKRLFPFTADRRQRHQEPERE
jgi:uroporphyrin-III C-methyltransferase/precorrin-2 dehydrogenase/sirohydrochlorin ferrochelatase